ncbi:MAG TPA: cupin domain-containing protein, partial [Fimbriimonadaceae bacterium]|nr:cupin domain-containing protein [Fimbriimonadaceae bacterium]
MPQHIQTPTVVPAHGDLPKVIREFVGLLNTGDDRVSIAHMSSPSGWSEPGQRPDVDEFTIVLEGSVRVEHQGGEVLVRAGEALHTKAGEWVRYSTP